MPQLFSNNFKKLERGFLYHNCRNFLGHPDKGLINIRLLSTILELRASVRQHITSLYHPIRFNKSTQSFLPKLIFKFPGYVALLLSARQQGGHINRRNGPKQTKFWLTLEIYLLWWRGNATWRFSVSVCSPAFLYLL